MDNIKRSFIMILIIFCIFLGCSNNDDDEYSENLDLTTASIQYNNIPELNQETIISIGNSDQKFENSVQTSNKFVWKVLQQPNNENLKLNISNDELSAKFIPSFVGEYRLKIESLQNNNEVTTSFVITNSLPYDDSKKKGLTGLVENQVFISSSILTEKQLIEIVNQYDFFSVVGYDPAQGLLVEYDNKNKDCLTAIENLKLKKGIKNVLPRMITPLGRSVIKSSSYSSEQWHFNFLNIDELHKLTSGSSSFEIGIVDGGFDTTNGKDITSQRVKHKDLQGRFSFKGYYTPYYAILEYEKYWDEIKEKETVDDTDYCKQQFIKEVFNTNEFDLLVESNYGHGIAVAGTIGALKNEAAKISGINQNSRLKGISWLAKLPFERLSSAKLINYSAGSSSKEFLCDDGILWDEVSYEETDNGKKEFETNVKYIQSFLLGIGSNTLLVTAAGNDGKNAKKANGAFHYFNNRLKKLDNLIVVAAVTKNNILTGYSNYGKSIDIAAPTGFKSTHYKFDNPNAYVIGTNYGENYYFPKAGFNGTSAASPVVAGIASLIFSLSNDFSPSDVKNIIIKSAIQENKFVEKRYTDTGSSTTELLSEKIPLLCAENALKYAKEIINGRRVTVAITTNNPFYPQIELGIETKFEVLQSKWTIVAFKDNNWINIETELESEDDNITLLLDHLRYKVQVKGDAKHKESEVNVNYISDDFYINLTNINIKIVNGVNLSPIPYAQLSVERILFLQSYDGGSDEEGSVNLHLLPGIYRIHCTADGYKNFSMDLTVSNEGQTELVTLPMAPDNIDQTGSISGYVYNEQDEPIINALVRISGGSQTNGFFASSSTNNLGRYQISNIKTTDSNGQPIETFFISVTALNFAEEVKEGVVILEGNERIESFVLKKQDISNNLIYSNSFEEDDIETIELTGLWTKTNFAEQHINNMLVERGYSSLAPDEATEIASLPKAYDGNYAIWYGQAETGSFILEQSEDDSLKSGGTSVTSNSGNFTLPVVSLTNTIKPILRFNTWWEIESVNPNESGYDLMDIKISINKNDFETIKRLNPHVDPNDEDRNHKPYSSGGFNRKPVWVQEEIDLTDYTGSSIQIQFSFDTKDHRYNGFRGWIIDNIIIYDGTIDTNEGSSNKRHRKSNLDYIYKHFSKEYIEVHKKPLQIKDNKLSFPIR